MIALLLFCVTPTVEELRTMPGVAEVTVRPAEKSSHRIIQILDWHYLTEKRFRLDTPEGDYAAFLASVEALQKQQRAVLLKMGVREVFLEGLTAKSQEHFSERIATLKKL